MKGNKLPFNIKYLTSGKKNNNNNNNNIYLSSTPATTEMFLNLDQSISLLDKLLKTLYKEASSNEKASVFAGMTMALGDNAVYWMLNTNAAEKICKWLDVSGKGKDAFKYALLINGAASITSINYYSASLLTQETIRITGRIPLIPSYYRWFISVIFMATVVSAFACSGAVGLTYELYKDKDKISAIFFSATTAIVNMLIANFFAVQLFRKNPFQRLTEVQNSKLSEIKLALKCFGHNLSSKSDEEFKRIILELKDKANTNKFASTSTGLQALNEFKLLFNPIDTENISSLVNANEENINLLNESYRKNTQLSFTSRLLIRLFSAVNASAASWLYYHVGRLAFSTLLTFSQSSASGSDESSMEIPELENLVGACMATVAAINVFYSAEHLLIYFFRSIKEESLTKLLKHRSGKFVLITLIGFLSSLGAIDLVASYSKDETPKSLSTLSYIGGVSQLFFLNTNALSETPPWFAFRRFCDEVKYSFIQRPVDQKKDMLKENLDSLGEQIGLASGEDIDKIYQVMENYDFLPSLKK